MADRLDALAAEAARLAGPVARLRRELEQLHAGFTSERGRRAPDYLKSARARAAYTASIGLPNFARARFVLERVGGGLGPGERGLDVGAGPGSGALALASLSHPTAEITLLDRSGPALGAAERLFRSLFPEGPAVRTVKTDLLRGAAALPEGRFQVALAGHVLNELLPPRGRGAGPAEGLARALAGRLSKGGRLVILEPAQRVPSRALCGLREKLLAAGLRPLGPCSHAGACPVLASRARDWCVTDVPWQRPALVAEIDELLGTDRRRLRVSYLALSRDARPPAGRTHAVISEPMRSREGTILYLCGGKGRLAVRLPRPPAPPLPRGTLVRIPADARPRSRDRSGAPLMPLPDGALERVK